MALLGALGQGRYFSIWCMWLQRLRIGEEGGGLVIPARRRRWQVWQQAMFARGLASSVIGRSPGRRYREASATALADAVLTAPLEAEVAESASDKEATAGSVPDLLPQAMSLPPLAAGGWDNLKTEETLGSGSLDQTPAWARGAGQAGSDLGGAFGVRGELINSSGALDEDSPIIRGSTGRLRLPSLRRWVTVVRGSLTLGDGTYWQTACTALTLDAWHKRNTILYRYIMCADGVPTHPSAFYSSRSRSCGGSAAHTRPSLSCWACQCCWEPRCGEQP